MVNKEKKVLGFDFLTYKSKTNHQNCNQKEEIFLFRLQSGFRVISSQADLTVAEVSLQNGGEAFCLMFDRDSITQNSSHARLT